MKFDFELMNPPYDGSLHLKIINNSICFLNTGDCINLSPIRWVQDPLAEFKESSAFFKFKNVRQHTKSLEVITALDAQDYFDALIPIDLGIYDISNKFNDDFVLNGNLIRKLAKFNYENPCPLEYDKKLGWRVKVPNITCSSAANTVTKEVVFKMLLCYDGLHDGKPWYTFSSKNQNTKETEEITCSVGFETENQARNFINSFNLDLIRYYIQKVVISVDYTNPLQVFWLGNVINKRTQKKGYDSDWTNQDLIELFNLSEQDIEEVKKSYTSL